MTDPAAGATSALDGALAEIVQETFGVMFPFEMFEQFDGGPVLTGHSSLVHITGDLSHTVLLTFAPPLGDRISAGLFEMSVEELDDESRADALGELANVIGGAVKSLLTESCQLSLPTVTLGEGMPYLPGAVQTDMVTFTDGSANVTIGVWEQISGPSDQEAGGSA
jgi:chemotaxis protein CheX